MHPMNKENQMEKIDPTKENKTNKQTNKRKRKKNVLN